MSAIGRILLHFPGFIYGQRDGWRRKSQPNRGGAKHKASI